MYLNSVSKEFSTDNQITRNGYITILIKNVPRLVNRQTCGVTERMSSTTRSQDSTECH